MKVFNSNIANGILLLVIVVFNSCNEEDTAFSGCLVKTSEISDGSFSIKQSLSYSKQGKLLSGTIVSKEVRIIINLLPMLMDRPVMCFMKTETRQATFLITHKTRLLKAYHIWRVLHFQSTRMSMMP
jgi:hypothetical protein